MTHTRRARVCKLGGVFRNTDVASTCISPNDGSYRLQHGQLALDAIVLGRGGHGSRVGQQGLPSLRSATHPKHKQSINSHARQKSQIIILRVGFANQAKKPCCKETDGQTCSSSGCVHDGGNTVREECR